MENLDNKNNPDVITKVVSRLHVGLSTETYTTLIKELYSVLKKYNISEDDLDEIRHHLTNAIILGKVDTSNR